MKIILLQDVKKMGQRGSIIEVADGYANSFLIPRGIAKVASSQDIIHSEKKQASAEQKKNEQEQFNNDLFKKLNKKTVVISGNTNPKGHLFSAVKVTDITSKLPGLKPDHLVFKSNIKEIGQYEIPLHIGKNKGIIIADVQR